MYENLDLVTIRGNLSITNQKTKTIEETVCRKIAERAERGKSKYGVTMERTDLTRKQWLQHAQEEAMDFAIYLEKLIQIESELQKEKL